MGGSSTGRCCGPAENREMDHEKVNDISHQPLQKGVDRSQYAYKLDGDVVGVIVGLSEGAVVGLSVQQALEKSHV